MERGTLSQQEIDFINEARELCEEFGLAPYGFIFGVVAVEKSTQHTLDFNYQEWEWLKPILRELKNYREGKI
jgi:hypothetical protein